MPFIHPLKPSGPLTGADLAAFRSIGWKFVVAKIVPMSVLAFGSVLVDGIPLFGGLFLALIVAPIDIELLLDLERHRVDQAIQSRYGLANWIASFRLNGGAFLAGSGLAGLMATGPRDMFLLYGWLPFGTYALLVALDGLDGVLARRAGLATDYGERLDLEADAVGVVGASLVGVATGALPGWFLLVGLARYLMGAALYVEDALGRSAKRLDPSRFRRRMAGFAMAFLVVALAPPATRFWTEPTAAVLAVPFLVGFVRDWMVRSGRLDPEGDRWRRALGLLARYRRPALLAFGVALAVSAAAALAFRDPGPLRWSAAALTGLLLIAPDRLRLRSPDPGGADGREPRSE